jgi:hypothetical protein
MIKRVLVWLLGIIVVLVAAVVLAVQLSPWPAVAIIQHAFPAAIKRPKPPLRSMSGQHRHATESRLWRRA